MTAPLARRDRWTASPAIAVARRVRSAQQRPQGQASPSRRPKKHPQGRPRTEPTHQPPPPLSAAAPPQGRVPQTHKAPAGSAKRRPAAQRGSAHKVGHAQTPIKKRTTSPNAVEHVDHRSARQRPRGRPSVAQPPWPRLPPPARGRQSPKIRSSIRNVSEWPGLRKPGRTLAVAAAACRSARVVSLLSRPAGWVRAALEGSRRSPDPRCADPTLAGGPA